VALILDKLVENAATYSHPPVRVRLEVDPGIPGIRVVDFEIGIPSGQQSLVFDQFHRVDRPDFGYPSGIRLGLFLAQQHAEAMGGRLLLEKSEIGVGSISRLEVPASNRRRPKGQDDTVGLARPPEVTIR